MQRRIYGNCKFYLIPAKTLDPITITSYNSYNIDFEMGYVYDEETELFYLRSRYYTASISRFINCDAFLNGLRLLANNTYCYCGNSVILLSDINGTKPRREFCYAAANLDGGRSEVSDEELYFHLLKEYFPGMSEDYTYSSDTATILLEEANQHNNFINYSYTFMNGAVTWMLTGIETPSSFLYAIGSAGLSQLVADEIVGRYEIKDGTYKYHRYEYKMVTSVYQLFITREVRIYENAEQYIVEIWECKNASHGYSKPWTKEMVFTVGK